MSSRYPRSLRRWLLAIALLHWLVAIILLLGSLKRHTAQNRPIPPKAAPAKPLVAR